MTNFILAIYLEILEKELYAIYDHEVICKIHKNSPKLFFQYGYKTSFLLGKYDRAVLLVSN